MRLTLRVAITAAIWCAAAAAQSKTTVAQTGIQNATGGLASGYFTIAPTAAFTAADGTLVGAAAVKVTLVNGAFSVQLEPNDSGTPVQTAYTVAWQLDGARPMTQVWAVPTTGATLHVSDVLVSQVTMPYGVGSGVGPPAKSILDGTGAPSNATGADGDLYLDTAATCLYGPKSAGAWGGCTSLVGSASGIIGAPGTWPTTFPPSGHASTHGSAGSDAVSLDGSQIATGTINALRIPTLNQSTSGNAATATAPAASWPMAACSTPAYVSGGTTTINWTLSNCAEMTAASGNTTIAFTSPTAPTNVTLKVTRDSTARTVAWPANAYGFPTYLPGDSAVQNIDAWFDGTSYWYRGSACPNCTYGIAATAAKPSFNPASGFVFPYYDATCNAPASLDAVGNQYCMPRVASLASHNFVTGMNADGTLHGAQPAWADVLITAHNIVGPLACTYSGGSATAQSCTTSPSFTLAAGDMILYETATGNSGDLTVAVNGGSAIHVRKWLSAATLAAGDLPPGITVPLLYDGTYLEALTIGNAPSSSGSGCVPGGSSGNFLTDSGSGGCNSSGTFTTSTVPTMAGAQTLTNKRINPRVDNESGTATSYTPNADSYDHVEQITSTSTGFTWNAPSGTPVDGQRLILKMQCTNSSAQTLTFNAAYVGGSDVALPSQCTGSSKIDQFGFLYDTINSKWEMVAVARGY